MTGWGSGGPPFTSPKPRGAPSFAVSPRRVGCKKPGPPPSRLVAHPSPTPNLAVAGGSPFTNIRPDGAPSFDWWPTLQSPQTPPRWLLAHPFPTPNLGWWLTLHQPQTRRCPILRRTWRRVGCKQPGPHPPSRTPRASSKLTERCQPVLSDTTTSGAGGPPFTNLRPDGGWWPTLHQSQTRRCPILRRTWRRVGCKKPGPHPPSSHR